MTTKCLLRDLTIGVQVSQRETEVIAGLLYTGQRRVALLGYGVCDPIIVANGVLLERQCCPIDRKSQEVIHVQASLSRGGQQGFRSHLFDALLHIFLPFGVHHLLFVVRPILRRTPPAVRGCSGFVHVCVCVPSGGGIQVQSDGWDQRGLYIQERPPCNRTLRQFRVQNRALPLFRPITLQASDRPRGQEINLPRNRADTLEATGR